MKLSCPILAPDLTNTSILEVQETVLSKGDQLHTTLTSIDLEWDVTDIPVGLIADTCVPEVVWAVRVRIRDRVMCKG